MARIKLEYIWLDGYEPVQNLRGKTKVVDGLKKIESGKFSEFFLLSSTFSKNFIISYPIYPKMPDEIEGSCSGNLILLFFIKPERL